MIQLLGWSCTVFIVFAFYLNAIKKYAYAIYIWILGDLGWIWYDSMIHNYSHAALSTVIILINIYGYYKLKTRIMKKKDIMATRDLFF